MESKNVFDNANKNKRASQIIAGGINVMSECDKIFNDIEADGTYDCTMLLGLTLKDQHQVVQGVDSLTKRLTAMMIAIPQLASNSKWMVILRTLLVLQNDVLHCYAESKENKTVKANRHPHDG